MDTKERRRGVERRIDCCSKQTDILITTLHTFTLRSPRLRSWRTRRSSLAFVTPGPASGFLPSRSVASAFGHVRQSLNPAHRSHTQRPRLVPIRPVIIWVTAEFLRILHCSHCRFHHNLNTSDAIQMRDAHGCIVVTITTSL